MTQTLPRSYRAVKRAFDIVVSGLALLLLSPVLLAILLAVKVDSPGPAIFSQFRTGKHGRRFRMWKFRTMVRDAESRKEDIAHLNVLPFPDFKVPDDPRITQVGRFLRRTSLDELPQLVNVLVGEMSLVGPRPTSFSASTYDLWHTTRLEVSPGLTGLWQINGRHELSTFDERLRLDIAYVRQMSFRSDLRILFRTATAVVRREGA